MSKKMPAVLYIYEDGQGDDRYFVACKKIDETADPGDSRLVGEYKLVKSHRVSMLTKVVPA